MLKRSLLATLATCRSGRGNLVCTVAHLLDPDGDGGDSIGDILDLGGLLDTVLGLLNQILGGLGGLGL